jgi:hypothetical protein
VVVLDPRFYAVLRAAVSASADASSCTERVAGVLADTRDARAYLAEMVDDGWLEGAIDRGPVGEVRGVYVRSLSAAGRHALVERLSRSAGPGGLQTLGRIATESQAIDMAEASRLKTLGLVMKSGALSELGALLLSSQSSWFAGANTTVIQGISNSQVAVGASHIEGSLSVSERPLDLSDLKAAVEELTSRVAGLELLEDTHDEVMADLASIRIQLDSPKPKRAVIHACAENVRAVLQGAVGSAVYTGLLEALKRLMS